MISFDITLIVEWLMLPTLTPEVLVRSPPWLVFLGAIKNCLATALSELNCTACRLRAIFRSLVSLLLRKSEKVLAKFLECFHVMHFRSTFLVSTSKFMGQIVLRAKCICQSSSVFFEHRSDLQVQCFSHHIGVYGAF